jgi:hypothetical protein
MLKAIFNIQSIEWYCPYAKYIFLHTLFLRTWIIIPEGFGQLFWKFGSWKERSSLIDRNYLKITIKSSSARMALIIFYFPTFNAKKEKKIKYGVW